MSISVVNRVYRAHTNLLEGTAEVTKQHARPNTFFALASFTSMLCVTLVELLTCSCFEKTAE